MLVSVEPEELAEQMQSVERVLREVLDEPVDSQLLVDSSGKVMWLFSLQVILEEM